MHGYCSNPVKSFMFFGIRGLDTEELLYRSSKGVELRSKALEMARCILEVPDFQRNPLDEVEDSYPRY